ncbi:MAG: hypothetical protein WD032_08915 [Nitrospirales bacterium]
MMTVTKRISHPSLAPVEFSDKQLEVFRVLYPLFKEEVFKRREHMMRLTARGSTVLIVILVALFILSPWSVPSSPSRWFLISGVALFSSLFAYLILQHADRHRMAKQQVIELEKTLGLYQEEWKLTGESLFPKNWQTEWATDRSVTLYLVALATLTTLVICSLFVSG